MKLLIITGASSGIGLTTAERFLADGHRVVNLSRRPCPLPDVTHIRCDLGVPEFIDDLKDPLTPLLETAETIALIHNAARFDADNAIDTPSENLRRVLEINLIAPNTLDRLIIPFMKPGSSVLFVGSTLSQKAVPGAFSYVTSKHAVIGMMRATCQDLVGRGVHTACICPGFTDTEMLRQHVPDDVMEQIKSMSTFNRLVEPGEIASLLHWAAHNPAINGSVLHANLGQIER